MFCGTSWVSASATFTMPSRRISSQVMEVMGLAALTLGDRMRVPVTCTSVSSSSSGLFVSLLACSAANRPEDHKRIVAAPSTAADARANDAHAAFLDNLMPPKKSYRIHAVATGV